MVREGAKGGSNHHSPFQLGPFFCSPTCCVWVLGNDQMQDTGTAPLWGPRVPIGRLSMLERLMGPLWRDAVSLGWGQQMCLCRQGHAEGSGCQQCPCASWHTQEEGTSTSAIQEGEEATDQERTEGVAEGPRAEGEEESGTSLLGDQVLGTGPLSSLPSQLPSRRLGFGAHGHCPLCLPSGRSCYRS